MMIRHATIHDLKGVVALGIEALEINPIEQLVIDEDKVVEAATVILNDRGSYCGVVVDDNDQIVAAVSALVHDIMFYKRRQASVLQFYSKAPPGWGMKLIRHFIAWTKERPIIKMITFTLDGTTDPRVPIMLARLGFSPDLPVYVRYR